MSVAAGVREGTLERATGALEHNDGVSGYGGVPAQKERPYLQKLEVAEEGVLHLMLRLHRRALYLPCVEPAAECSARTSLHQLKAGYAVRCGGESRKEAFETIEAVLQTRVQLVGIDRSVATTSPKRAHGRSTGAEGAWTRLRGRGGFGQAVARSVGKLSR